MSRFFAILLLAALEAMVIVMVVLVGGEGGWVTVMLVSALVAMGVIWVIRWTKPQELQ